MVHLEEKTVSVPQKTFRSVHKNEKHAVAGEVVGKMVKLRYYSYYDSSVNDLSHDFDNNPEINCVAIVDSNKKPLGLVTRKRFYDVMGKPFGIELFHNKPVTRLAVKSITIDLRKNIYSLAEEYESELHSDEDIFFCITNGSEYYGTFTSRDMLVYLSNITRKDLNLARSLQSSIVKEDCLFESERVLAVGASRMAKGVGGDFYDIRKNGENKSLFSICDVCGKGVPASLVATCISGMFNVYDFKKGIPDFIRAMNSYLHSHFGAEKFVTSLILDIDEKSGIAEIYDMGHSFIFLFRRGKMFRLNSSNDDKFPLGVCPEGNYVPDKIQMESGDCIIIITDGIAEQCNAKGDQYGVVRLGLHLEKFRSEGLKKIKDEIMKDIESFRKEHPVGDDMTMVILEYK